MKLLKITVLALCITMLTISSVTVYASSVPGAEDGNPAQEGAQASGDGQTLPEGSEAPVSFTPKMIVQSCHFSGTSIQAGDEVQADIILYNTSKTETVRNMTVTVSEDGAYLNLLSPTDTIYVDSVPAGGSCTVTYIYKVQTAALEGQYQLNVSMDYADTKGGSYSATGRASLTVEQPVRLEFDPIIISSEVQVGDIIQIEAHAMNLGRSTVHNIRAVIEADGLVPDSTIFIGDLEAGTMGAGRTDVTITGLTERMTPYGKTEGSITFYYEDEAGNAYEEAMLIRTNITSPFSEEAMETKEPDKPGQWWILMTLIGTILTLFAAGIAIRIVRRKRQFL